MKILLSLFVVALAFPALAVTKADVIQNISYNVILETYKEFAQKSRDLQTAVDALVAQPTPANLEKAQAAWRDARRAYEISEGFLFGPMDSLGIDPMIDTWPLALSDLKKILASNYDLNVDFVRTLGSEVQGFHAIEYILFGEGVVANTRDVRGISAREFQYVSAATTLLVEQTDLLLTAWISHSDPEDVNSPAYVQVISQPGANNAFYTSEEAVIEEFANGIVGILTEASEAKLPDATGNSPEEANARLEESPFSWNSLNDYAANVDSIHNVYIGKFNGRGGPGLKDLVAAKNPALAEEVEAQILAARVKIYEIAGPENISFGQAIKTPAGRARIFAAIAELKKVQALFEDEVIPLL